MLAVLQEMLTLPQTPSSLVSLLTEKLLILIPDDHRRIQTVSYILNFDLKFYFFFSTHNELNTLLPLMNSASWAEMKR